MVQNMGKHCRSIFEVMHDGIMEVIPTGRIVYVNPVCRNLLGVPENQLLGSDFFQLFSERERPEIHAACVKVIGNKNGCEERQVNMDDREFLLRVVAVQAEPDNSLVIVLKDTTEKSRLEKKLNQAEKMEALGNLAGGIAHNFNNLLTAIQGNLSILMMTEGLEEEHLVHLRQMENCVDSGSALTRELLKFARGGAERLERLDLNQIVKESSEMFRVTSKRIQIRRNLQKDLWVVDADAGQLEQVLLNLYVNAQQAMPHGGEILLETRNVTCSKKVDHSFARTEGKFVKISVSDTGNGIHREHLEKIFDPFFTTKAMGSGLGLSTAQNTIKKHNGAIRVKNNDKGGATFEVLIPASKDQPGKEAFLIKNEVASDTPFLLWKKDEILRAASCY